MRLALCFCLWFVAAAAALEPPPPYFNEAAQDAGGIIWAYSRAESGRIYRFDGKAWTAQAAPFEHRDRAMPAKVVRMTDGGVACLWRLDAKQFAVTRHEGNEGRLLGTCPGEMPGSGLDVMPLADAQNRLWITGQFARIYRVDAKGVSLAHEITPGELAAPGRAKEGFNKVHAAEDGRGRVWVWSAAEASNWAALRGVLIFDGEKAELHDLTTHLKKGARPLTFARADDRHMWMAVADDGLYLVDIDTLVAERQPDPSPKALCCVDEIFVHGGDVFAVESNDDDSDALWRRRGGQWQRIVATFDASTNPFMARSWLTIPEGLLVQSSGGGPWFLPTEGEPAQFSWRTGYPLEGAHSLARYADGTFFALNAEDAIFHGALDLPPRARGNARLVELDTHNVWKLDAAARPWMIFRDSRATLRQWDGERWIAHAIPDADGQPDENDPPTILTDAEGRVWVMPFDEGKLHILDTKTDQWQRFPGVREAYLALRDRPPHFLASPDPNESTFDPQYSADRRRIAFRGNVGAIYYYDGASWQRFDRAKITGSKASDHSLGPPWFDPEGKLSVNIRPKATWRRDDAGHWSPVAFESHFPVDIWSENARRPTLVPPEGSVTNEPDAIAVDNLGTFWLGWKGNLYRCIPGQCVPVFGPEEVNPFLAGTIVSSAFVDAHGNAFLFTGGERTGVFLLRPKSPPPRTEVTVTAGAADAVKVRWHTASTLPVRYRWRLDDGPWQATDESVLTLDDLPNGPHTVAVTARDADLQAEAVPAVAKFAVNVDRDRQQADLLARLGDPDYDKRKAAVDGLARQPDLATPALQNARETADDDKRWWIDAALEKIRTMRHAAASQPTEPSPAGQD